MGYAPAPKSRRVKKKRKKEEWEGKGERGKEIRDKRTKNHEEKTREDKTGAGKKDRQRNPVPTNPPSKEYSSRYSYNEEKMGVKPPAYQDLNRRVETTEKKKSLHRLHTESRQVRKGGGKVKKKKENRFDLEKPGIIRPTG